MRTPNGDAVNDMAKRWRRKIRRTVSRHRRLLAAGLAAGAVALTIAALQPPPAATVAVLAAAEDLSGGAALDRADLTTVRLPGMLVPAGALRPSANLSGRILAAPVRRGEPLTDARIVGPGLLHGERVSATEVVAVPVRLADAEAARLLKAGDRVDVLAADAGPNSGGDAARVAARGVRVLAVPAPTGERGLGATQFSEGALVVIATSPEVAAVLARSAVTARLSVTIREG